MARMCYHSVSLYVLKSGVGRRNNLLNNNSLLHMLRDEDFLQMYQETYFAYFISMVHAYVSVKFTVHTFCAQIF